MSTLILENIKHPDASGNALELSADGTISNGASFSSAEGITVSGYGVAGVTINQDQQDSTVSARLILKNATNAGALYYNNTNGWVFNTGTVSGSTSGTPRVWIDTEGLIHTPYRPAFRVGSASGFTVNSASTLVFPTVYHNIGSHYNNSNGRFTAPIDGIYSFSMHANVRDIGGNVASSLWCKFLKNGGEQTVCYVEDNPDGSWKLLSHTTTVQCNAGDYIEVQSGGGIYWDSSGWSQFTGHLIG